MRNNPFARILLLMCSPYILAILFPGCVCDIKTMYYKYDFNLLGLYHVESTRIKEGSEIPAIPKTAYGIEVKLSAVSVPVSQISDLPVMAIFNQANAMTKRACIYSEYQPSDSMAAISILGMQQVDGNWQNRGEVGSRFRVYDGKYLTLEQHLNGLSYPDYNQQVQESNVSMKWQYLLMEPFTEAGLYKFKILVTMKAGHIIENTTSPVYLQ